jgi:uncharacterized membrane protein
MSIAKGLRNYFLRGLAVLLPTILTIWILAWGYSFIQDNIGVYINLGLVRLTMLVKGLDWHDESIRKVWSDFWVDGWGSIAGFIIAVVAVCIVGAILASVVGRAIWRMIEGFIMNTPLLRRVYPYVKQITDFLLTQDKKKELFSRVVAVEYPRKGSWSIGFVTGSGLKKVVDNIEKEFLTILIPNSPMPVTGYVIMVPKEQTIALDMTVEEAFRFAISAGVIAPSDQQAAALPKADLENKEER